MVLLIPWSALIGWRRTRQGKVVITLGRDAQSIDALRTFSTALGLGASGLMLVLALTGADELFFSRVLSTSVAIAHLAHLKFLFSAAVRLLDALQSYVRGLLTAQHRTISRLLAVAAAMTALFAALGLGAWLQWPGVALSGSAFTASLACELAVLVGALRHC